MPLITVILCSHNPRVDYLSRTLNSLRTQTLDRKDWELVLVDNNSVPPISLADSSLDLPCTILRESKLGLTHARLAGINVSHGDLLVFLDDDNILAPDYLSEALRIANAHPEQGAWGGSCCGEFERKPPSWAHPYLVYLALREVNERIVTSVYDVRHVPFGAGLCLRREIALSYVKKTVGDGSRLALDRRGNALTSGGDTDMVFCAIDSGFSFALHPTLRLVHLMPDARLDPAYLARLLEGIAASTPVVFHLHGVNALPARVSFLKHMLQMYRLWRQPKPIWQLERARARGLRTARKFLARLPQPMV